MAHGQGLHFLHERRLTLSHAATAVVCALLAGALGAVVPAMIRRLPAPVEQTVDEPVAPSYAAVANTPNLPALTALVSGAAGGAIGWRIGLVPSLLADLIPVVPVLVMLAVIDWRTRLLPRTVALPATAAVLAVLGIEWAARHDTAVFVRAVLGMLLARTLFWLAWWLRPTAVGFGDVRLAALVGLVLGRLGWATWAAGLYAGLLVFAVYGIVQLVRTRSRRALGQPLPYGPFMAAGLLAGVLLAS